MTYFPDLCYKPNGITLRIDYEDPMLSNAHMPQLFMLISNQLKLGTSTRDFFYETPRVVNVRGQLYRNTPSEVLSHFRKKYHFPFNFEYVLDVQFKMDGSIVLERFD